MDIQREQERIRLARQELLDREKALEQELRNLQESEAKARYEHDPRIPIAIRLHKKLCHYNHADGCGWFYNTKWEAWDTEYSHKQFLERAQKVIDFARELEITTDDVLRIIEEV